MDVESLGSDDRSRHIACSARTRADGRRLCAYLIIYMNVCGGRVILVSMLDSMAVSPLMENPFAVLTAVVAPAVLTNASSVLCLGTGNRIARVVDRTRVITAEMSALEPGTPDYQVRLTQLERLKIRAQLLYRALRILYASLGSFAAAALISVAGSALAFYGQHLAFQATAIIGLATGAFAVWGLVFGCALMVRETRVALQNIAEEAEYARTRWKPTA